MFWNFGPRVDKVSQLLENDDVTLVQILEEDSISSSIRNSQNEKLFDFLRKQENIKELLKWALTDEYKDHQKYTKLSNAAVTIFSSSKPFQQIILEDQIFMDKIKEFSTSKPPSSRTCGHYLRIIESLANGTKGEILNQLNNFSDFLINNITDMALKDLFVLMTTEFTESFGFNTDLLIKLVLTINEENCLFVVSAIRDIINNNNELKSTFFDSESFIDHLFESAIKLVNTQPLLATELFRLIKSFKDLKSFSFVHEKYNNSYEYQINLSLPFQIQVFGKLNQHIFDLFFDPKSCSLLIEAIYQSFIGKSQEEQCQLVKDADLRQKIIDNFSKSITNGRIADLADIIYKDFIDLSENDESFNSFVNINVEPRIDLRNSKYGGKVCNDSDEDEDFDDSDEQKNQIENIDLSDSDSSYSDSNDEEVDGSDSGDDHNDLNNARRFNINIDAESNSLDDENQEVDRSPEEESTQEDESKQSDEK